MNMFNRVKLPILIASITVLLVIFVGLVYRNRPLNSLISEKLATPSTTPMPNEQQYPTDTENDGVYTNYKYGFRFKYSNEFFKSMFQSNDSVYWRNEEKDIAENESAIELSVLIWEDNGAKYNEQGLDYKTAYIQRFNEFLNIKDGEKVPRGAVRISRYKGADYDRIIYSYTAPPGGESEYKKHYAAWWLKTGYPVIEVRYTAGANNTLERYKPEFDKIIDSFEFITK